MLYMLGQQGCTTETTRPPAGKASSPAVRVAVGPTTAASGAPGTPSASPAHDEDRPIVGKAPATDPSSWLWVPADALLGALVTIDKKPATTLTAAQINELDALLKEVDPVGKARVEAERNLAHTADAILTMKQTRLLQENRSVVVATPIDADVLIKLLEKKATAAPPTHAATDADVDVTFTSTYLLAGLTWLEQSGTEKLSAEQAAILAPLVKAVDDKTRVQSQYYPRLARILTQKQLDAFVAVLGDMQSGKTPPLSSYVTYVDATAHFKARKAQ